jgi:lipopolysaccharide/colanic/teichoic acid biosynthesis glycosyltransferase
MEQEKGRDYSDLVSLLAEPDLFDGDRMPLGRDYLVSSSKLAVDLAMGLGVLPFCALPTIAGASGVVAIDHTNPLFRQTRIGYMGRPFSINKLTTMPGLPEETHSNGRHDDERRSRLGRILSLLRIDEAPQLVNVARREMSVIGPRPLIRPYLTEVRYLIGAKESDEWMKVRALGRPGIFDGYSNWWHSQPGVEIDPAEQLRIRIEMEKRYLLETASAREDFRILKETLALFGTTAIRHNPVPGIARRLARK